jgi:hypothetical protein
MMAHGLGTVDGAVCRSDRRRAELLGQSGDFRNPAEDLLRRRDDLVPERV